MIIAWQRCVVCEVLFQDDRPQQPGRHQRRQTLLGCGVIRITQYTFWIPRREVTQHAQIGVFIRGGVIQNTVQQANLRCASSPQCGERTINLINRLGTH